MVKKQLLVAARRILAGLHPGRSLKTQVCVSFGGITLLLAVVLSLTIARNVEAQISHDRGAFLTEIAYQTADKLDRGMFERYRDIQNLATLEPIHDPSYSPAQRRALLERLQSTYTDYSWIGLTDARGQVVAGTGGLLEGKNVSERPWFTGALAGPYVGDVHEAVLLAKLLPNPTGEPLRFVDVSMPVVDERGALVGVLAAHLSWTWAGEVQDSLLMSPQDRGRVEIIILDQHGKVLLGAPELQGQMLDLGRRGPAPGEKQRAAAPGEKRQACPIVAGFNGVSYLAGTARGTGYRSYPGLGWTIMAWERVDVAFAPAAQIQRQTLGAGLMLGALFAGLGWLVASHLVGPLKAIALAAERIRHGDWSAAIPVARGRDERAVLAESLRNLVRDLTAREAELRALNDSLEQRVRERTRQLATSNAELTKEVEERRHAEAALRKSEATNRALLNAIPDTMFRMSGDGVYLDFKVQPGHPPVIGRECCPGKRLSDVLPANLVHCSMEHIEQALHSGAPQIFEYQLAHNGDPHDFEARVVVCGEGEVLMIVRDITERKKVDRMKSEFISVVSHELRTPLTSIRGSLGLIAGRVVGDLPPRVQSLVDIAHKNSERLVRLINDILDVEKIESGRMEFLLRPIELAVLVEQAIEANRAYGKQYQVAFALEDRCPGVKVNTDSDRLIQALTNLLSNAAKHSPPDDTVVVTIVRAGERMRVAVADHGSGIPESFREHVFEKFAQADITNTRQRGGSGLGLSITKAIVENLDGWIGFETEIGAGTTFFLDLPEWHGEIVPGAEQLKALP